LKILLIYCDDSSAARFGESRKEFPPLGLLYLAAACEKNGIDVELFNLSNGDLTALPRQYIIGLSINSSFVYPAFYNRVKLIRKMCDVLVAGGQHATIFPRETLLELEADYLIIGEGEYSLPGLIHDCRDGLKPCYDNVIAKGDMGKIYTEATRIDNLDNLPFPARHLMNDAAILLDKRIYGEEVKCISLITSRGCPHNCGFCANVYKGFRHRSVNNIGNEIDQLLLDYPEVRGLVFLDENLLFSPDHVKLLCEKIAKYRLKWTCNARVDYFSRPLIRQMRNCGCVEIKYGVESGSQRILDKMDKKITVSQISEAVIGTHEAGIRTKCFLMFGFPGDNLESAKETISFIDSHEKFISRINLFSFSPLPNSPIFNKLGKPQNDDAWENYRIYNQHIHWWGTQAEYEEMIAAYKLLEDYITERYGEYGTASSCRCGKTTEALSNEIFCFPAGNAIPGQGRFAKSEETPPPPKEVKSRPIVFPAGLGL